MTDLQIFLFHDVILTDIDKKEWKGQVFSFYNKDDNDDGHNSIVLKTLSGEMVEFTEPEILSMEKVCR